MKEKKKKYYKARVDAVMTVVGLSHFVATCVFETLVFVTFVLFIHMYTLIWVFESVAYLFGIPCFVFALVYLTIYLACVVGLVLETQRRDESFAQL